MDVKNLIEAFSEFKEMKNIDRETMMNILEEVFRTVLAKQYSTDENIDVIINIDKLFFVTIKKFYLIKALKIKGP